MRRSWAARSLVVMRAWSVASKASKTWRTWSADSWTNSRRIVADAGVSPGVEVGAGFLGFGAEDGVAAAYVG